MTNSIAFCNDNWVFDQNQMNDEPLYEHCYLIALGSNMRHPQYGLPDKVLEQAFRKFENHPQHDVILASDICYSRPIGASQRQYANAAAMVASHDEPYDFLVSLKNIEHDFGRGGIFGTGRGQKWRSRVLDLDIIFWGHGSYRGINIRTDRALVIPHPHYKNRDFVMKPAVQIAPWWRDPKTLKTLRQKFFINKKPKPLDLDAKAD